MFIIMFVSIVLSFIKLDDSMHRHDNDIMQTGTGIYDNDMQMMNLYITMKLMIDKHVYIHGFKNKD